MIFFVKFELHFEETSLFKSAFGDGFIMKMMMKSDVQQQQQLWEDADDVPAMDGKCLPSQIHNMCRLHECCLESCEFVLNLFLHCFRSWELIYRYLCALTFAV